MANRSSNRGKGHKDANELAFSIVQQSIGDAPKIEDSGKNPAAVTLGRLGGLKGGKARAAALTANERKLIATKAAAARWRKANLLKSGAEYTS